MKVLYCTCCNKPLYEVHPGAKWMKLLGITDRPRPENNYWLNLHSWEMAYEVEECNENTQDVTKSPNLLRNDTLSHVSRASKTMSNIGHV